MGRANNVSRSLIIMSKLRGWDPTKIDGADFPNNDYPEDRTTQGDGAHLRGPLPGSPEASSPHPSVPGPDTRGPGPGGREKRHNPMAGK